MYAYVSEVVELKFKDPKKLSRPRPRPGPDRTGVLLTRNCLLDQGQNNGWTQVDQILVRTQNVPTYRGMWEQRILLNNIKDSTIPLNWLLSLCTYVIYDRFCTSTFGLTLPHTFSHFFPQLVDPLPGPALFLHRNWSAALQSAYVKSPILCKASGECSNCVVRHQKHQIEKLSLKREGALKLKRDSLKGFWEIHQIDFASNTTIH